MKWDQRRASEEGISAAPVMDPVLLSFDLCTPHVMHTKLCERKSHPEGTKGQKPNRGTKVRGKEGATKTAFDSERRGYTNLWPLSELIVHLYV